MGDEARRALADVGYGIRCVLLPVVAVLIACAVALSSGGCDGAGAEEPATEANPFEGRFELHEIGLDGTYVLVDRETGICYVARYKGGVCVMVGADGLPVTVDEIGGDTDAD